MDGSIASWENSGKTSSCLVFFFLFLVFSVFGGAEKRVKGETSSRGCCLLYCLILIIIIIGVIQGQRNQQ
jgi:formate-dependent nitrite reductase membrane component NrfD